MKRTFGDKSGDTPTGSRVKSPKPSCSSSADSCCGGNPNMRFVSALISLKKYVAANKMARSRGLLATASTSRAEDDQGASITDDDAEELLETVFKSHYEGFLSKEFGNSGAVLNEIPNLDVYLENSDLKAALFAANNKLSEANHRLYVKEQQLHEINHELHTIRSCGNWSDIEEKLRLKQREITLMNKNQLLEGRISCLENRISDILQSYSRRNNLREVIADFKRIIGKYREYASTYDELLNTVEADHTEYINKIYEATSMSTECIRFTRVLLLNQESLIEQRSILSRKLQDATSANSALERAITKKESNIHILVCQVVNAAASRTRTRKLPMWATNSPAPDNLYEDINRKLSLALKMLTSGQAVANTEERSESSEDESERSSETEELEKCIICYKQKMQEMKSKLAFFSRLAFNCKNDRK